MNPEQTRYDAIVIGSGQGGSPLAQDLAAKGWKVALVERRRVGGTCINTGCTPTKTMVASAQVAHYARNAGRWGVRTFWREIPPAALMATASGSSFATIPMNLQAADRIGVPRDISETVIPIGATIHMDGSVLAAMLKIAFLFGIFGHSFDGPATIASAIGVALLSGMVMSGIPGGGFTGELLIVTMYGFPPEALVIISVIGTTILSLERASWVY